VDAETGKSVWTNSGEGSTYNVQPHNSPAFAGFIPHGHLAATPLGLVAPGGRTQPGCYDLKTGRLLSFSFGDKNAGTYHVTARGPWFFAGNTLRRLGDGTRLGAAAAGVHDEQALYSLVGNQLVAEALLQTEQKARRVDRLGKTIEVAQAPLKPLWKAALSDVPGTLWLKAGSRFYFGGTREVAAVEVRPKKGQAAVVWQAEIEGDPWTMLAASGRLVVVTRQGAIYCFGAAEGQQEAKTYRAAGSASPPGPSPAPSETGNPAEKLVARVLGETGATEGYAVVFGIGKAAWIDGLAGRTRLEQIVVDSDPAAVDRLRRRSEEQGLYGRRLSAHVGDAASFALPPYLASLVVVEGLPAPKGGDGGKDALGGGRDDGRDADWLRRIFELLRPYGGAACLPMDAARLEALAARAEIGTSRVKPVEAGCALLIREGPLPGAADWTHQYADAANTVVSQDDRVKTPLGLLWFGGPPNDEVLPRHGHGPTPQVAGGRLVIEGRNMLRALDVYTGRLLWQTALPDLGAFYDNTSHQPGANEIGSNYVTLPDAVYVVYGTKILKLDAASGRPAADFEIRADGASPQPNWGFLAAWEDLLVTTSAPLGLRTRSGPGSKRPAISEATDGNSPGGLDSGIPMTRYGAASRRLAVFDRHSGKLLWDRTARYGFRHNCIVLGGGRLFSIDGLSPAQRDVLKRRGLDFKDYAPRLLALDVRTGREAWSTGEDVFGTFLGYSAEHDVLLQAGSAERDRAADEVDQGMVAYRGTDGRVLWSDTRRKHKGPCMLHGDTIITQDRAYALLTGEPKTRRHPLSGEPVPWQFARNYGCNTAVAGRHVLTFRSAAAGYYDLDRDGGTGNLGGFKSGCTSSLIPAGGVLSAPEYTRTCNCPYQNQTSLALIHEPAAETWTFNAFTWDGKPVRRVGINFGAPGDRMADDGTLWLDWPSVGGPSPDLPIETEPARPETFRHHSGLVRVASGPPGLAWVAASGVRDVRRLTVTLAKDPAAPVRRYRVRLHFAEVDDLKPGARVFDVRVQDREAVSKLDIVREAGGPMTALVKEILGVEVRDKLIVELLPTGEGQSPGTILSGIEILPSL
jgi:outer membrane protein assembly factor BamB